MLFPIILAGILVGAHAGRSPNADLVENLLSTEQGSRYSTSIILDAILDVPSLVARYNYPIEFHNVVTADGYILRMHRIPHGRDSNSHRGPRPVVFLMHGLLSSSADWLVLGPGNALAYLLAEEGFDVWLGNARGNYYSRRHIFLDPDNGTDFWRFSWDEIGNYDLAAMIDYVLAVTQRQNLHYIGHSQGGTSFLVLNSLRPNFASKFASFHGLAPASFFIHNDHKVYNVLAPYQRLIEGVAFHIGIGEFLPNLQTTTALTLVACSDFSFLQRLCHAIPLLGDSIQNYNTTMLPVFIGHTPAGASIRQLAHYGQSINTGEFRRYDYGLFGNIATYSRFVPPAYDLSRVTTPAYLYYASADKQVHYEDLYHLSTVLPNVELVHRVPRNSFTHIDFIWGADAKSMYYDSLISKVKEAEEIYG